jgi:hypothetical protein
MLTIREAAEKTGHSPHKIRRLIKSIADQPANDDRSQVEPSPADVERLTAEGVQFTWRINEELVRRVLGEAVTTVADQKPPVGVGESAELLHLIQRAIDAKEHAEARLFEQLRVKDEQISALNERLRESNVLMASLQKQLPEGGKKPTGLLDSAAVEAGKPKGKGTASTPKKVKRSWFSWSGMR